MLSTAHVRVLGCLGLLAAVGMAVASCRGPEPKPIPEGVQTMTGVLLPAEISLTRRGTHILTVGDDSAYFVESAVINLRSYEGRLVAVRGVVERNVDPMDTPVIVAEEVKQVVDKSLREWKAPHIGLTMQIPYEWSVVNDVRSVKLFLSQSGSLIVDIFPEKFSDLPYDFKAVEMRKPDRSVELAPILIGSTRAVRMLTPRTGDQRISFPHETHLRSSSYGGQATQETATGSEIYDVLTFVYTPARNGGDELDTKFLSVIHSLSFSKSQALSSTSASHLPSSAGVGGGSPCGGPAGILCGPGEYCEVTELETNIGKCRKL